MSVAGEVRHQIRALISLVHRSRSEDASAGGKRSLVGRLIDVFLRTGDLGFTAFGVCIVLERVLELTTTKGPAVHFTILYGRFVVGGIGKGKKWIDEQTVSAHW